MLLYISAMAKTPKCKDLSTAEITITGTVQGVGFRPFIHRLAEKYAVSGTVINRTGSVLVTAAAPKKRLDAFIKAIPKEKPPPAQISAISVKFIGTRRFKGFSIEKSSGSGEIKQIPPDLCVCPDCLLEFNDKNDRRYHYPFINCTNCGPRFTIIKDTPYDRSKTSMKHFKMCPDCEKEYRDISNRRYHAEPNACPKCGPKAWLADKNGKKITVKDPFSRARELLKQGRIIAVKGLGGFHLAVNASDEKAVQNLKVRKKRSNKPFAVMADTIKKIRTFAHVTPDDIKLLQSSAAPVVLLPLRKNSAIAKDVALGLKHAGVFMPYTPLHYLLFDREIKALVMTSANMAEEPIQHDNSEAMGALAGIADYYLLHDRDILIPADDSVLKHSDVGPVFIRRSRGYVPGPVIIGGKNPDVIGTGALMKNSVCFIKGNRAIMSQHIGDLENAKAEKYFEETIGNFVKFYGIKPRAVACDKHPDYISTRFAESFAARKKIKLFMVQHHYSHMLSVMAEKGLKSKALGIILDGTGYGDDGNIWGGEFLIGDVKGFERAGHFKYIKLPGGDLASTETDRSAISILSGFLTDGEIIAEYGAERAKALLQALKLNINTPRSSSVGRLFDAAASITGTCSLSTYDAEAPMRFEAAAFDRKASKSYGYIINNSADSVEIDMQPAFSQLWQDRTRAMAPVNFHLTIANAAYEAAELISKKMAIKDIILSGGVFQNTVLLEMILKRLKKAGFNVLMHEKLPPNDGSIALGQAYYAANNI